MKSDIQKVIQPFLKAKQAKNVAHRRKINKPQEQLSKKQLLQYLKDKNIQRLKDIPEEGPNRYQFKKHFGSFTEAKRQAFPNKIFSFKPDTPEMTAEHIIKSIITFGLWRRKDYYTAHKNQPDAIPTLYQCTKLFGSWKNTTRAASKCQFSKQFDKYIKLVEITKKMPTMKQMDDADINLPLLIQTTHMTREELYQLAKDSGQHFKRMKKRMRKKARKKRKK
jgi:hypothetical protein